MAPSLASKTSHHAALRVFLLVVLASGLFGCDHATKIAAKASLENAAAVPLAPDVLHGALELKYVENTDVAFNMLQNLGIPRAPHVLVALSLVAMVSLGVMWLVSRRRARATGGDGGGESSRMSQAGIALIASGALGNLVDRVVRGYVVDFIHIKGWPVFNVADIAVVAGMGLMVLGARAAKKKTASSPPPPPRPGPHPPSA